MNAIAQYIVSNSKLDIIHIKITDATPDTFVMVAKARITSTGPTSSTISPMTVDLVGPVGAFGKLNLPVIKTSSSGTDVQIASQIIQITDNVAYKAFVTAVFRDQSLLLQLRNGKGSVKALMGLSTQIDYNKDCLLKGMHGPRTSITKIEVGEGGGFKSTMHVVNPSPVEIDLGTVKQEIRNADGSVVATQQGKAHILRGETAYVLDGKVAGQAAGNEAMLVGVGVGEDSWLNETITAFEEPVVLPQELLSLCA